MRSVVRSGASRGPTPLETPCELNCAGPGPRGDRTSSPHDAAVGGAHVGRRPNAPRPFRVPSYPVTPALFIAAAGAIVVNTFVARPLQAVAGIGIVILGTPVYLFWKRAARAPNAPDRS